MVSFFRSNYLEIIHIDRQHQRKPWMLITRWPLRTDGNKPHRPHVCITLLLPVGISVRVPIQSLLEPAHGASKIWKLLFPPFWSSFRRKTDPCWITFHLRLNVGLLRVGNLNGMTWGTAKEIDSLSRLKRRKRPAQILEDSIIVCLIYKLCS